MNKLNPTVQHLNMRAKELFSTKAYGGEILEMTIGLICVEEEYQKLGFLTVRKPRFQKTRKETKSSLGGGVIVREKYLTWDVNLNLGYVLEAENQSQILDYVIDTVLTNLSHLNKYRKFDKEIFMKDLSTLKVSKG